MPSFNRVTLMGNMTRDPQLKFLPSQVAVCDFGLAINRRFKTADGQDRDEVTFVDCSAFGRQAETINQYCKKGNPLFVEGRLKYDTWDGRDGNKRSKLSVVVENFQFISPRREESSEQQQPADDVPGSTDVPPIERNRTPNPAPKAKFAQADVPF